MINVAEIVADSDFAQYYTVHRITGNFVKGRFVSNQNVTLQYYGLVTTANEKEIIQVPEADRTTIMMCFYSTSDNPFYLTREASNSKISDTKEGISDQITWQNDRYKIVKIWPYLDYGYWKCIGNRLSGEG